MNELQTAQMADLIQTIECGYPTSYVITASNALVRSLGGTKPVEELAPAVAAIYVAVLVGRSLCQAK